MVRFLERGRVNKVDLVFNQRCAAQISDTRRKQMFPETLWQIPIDQHLMCQSGYGFQALQETLKHCETLPVCPQKGQHV